MWWLKALVATPGSTKTKADAHHQKKKKKSSFRFSSNLHKLRAGWQTATTKVRNTVLPPLVHTLVKQGPPHRRSAVNTGAEEHKFTHWLVKYPSARRGYAAIGGRGRAFFSDGPISASAAQERGIKQLGP